LEKKKVENARETNVGGRQRKRKREPVSVQILEHFGIARVGWGSRGGNPTERGKGQGG